MVTKDIFCIIILLGCSILLMGCPKECVSPGRSYQATHRLKCPDSIHVGDTIWILSEMDCNDMYNYVTAQSESFCNANFSFTMVLQNFVWSETRYNHIGAVDLFTIVNTSGRIWNSKDIPSPHAVNQVEFGKQGDKYLLIVGVIPQQKGIFTMGLGNGSSIGSKHCDRSSLTNKIYPNASNEELLFLISNGRERTFEEKSRIFCFEVY